jgi:hypothetical protein
MLPQATREGLTGVEVPPVVEEPVPVPRGRPSLRAPRKKSAPAKPAAKPKPEPWMLPPLRPWTHVYKPAAAGAQPNKLQTCSASGPALIWKGCGARRALLLRVWCCSGGPASCEAAQA